MIQLSVESYYRWLCACQLNREKVVCTLIVDLYVQHFHIKSKGVYVCVHTCMFLVIPKIRTILMMIFSCYIEITDAVNVKIRTIRRQRRDPGRNGFGPASSKVCSEVSVLFHPPTLKLFLCMLFVIPSWRKLANFSCSLLIQDLMN